MAQLTGSSITTADDVGRPKAQRCRYDFHDDPKGEIDAENYEKVSFKFSLASVSVSASACWCLQLRCCAKLRRSPKESVGFPTRLEQFFEQIAWETVHEICRF